MLKRKAHPDTPWSSMKPREKPINKFSPDARSQRARQQRVYQSFDAASAGRCAGCGGTWFLTRSHCFSQKHYPEHRNDARNLLLLCVNCHDCYENNKLKFRRVCPEAWAETLRRMQEVDRPAFLRFQTLNPQLFT